MLIDRGVVEHVALLSRLKIDEKNLDDYTRQVNRILEFVEKLKGIDTEDIPPTAHVLPIQNVFREDEIEPSMPREKVLQNAPQKEQGCFYVPKIIES